MKLSFQFEQNGILLPNTITLSGMEVLLEKLLRGGVGIGNSLWVGLCNNRFVTIEDEMGDLNDETGDRQEVALNAASWEKDNVNALGVRFQTVAAVSFAAPVGPFYRGFVATEEATGAGILISYTALFPLAPITLGVGAPNHDFKISLGFR